ncbi:hypothetical protein CENSYa_0874 [Cenarchaeum symbiosum A]|uniref:Uncharacterized protein n=1 Tax=Cenarchaeum symbiosum (strain A) TaxID=414004 RepID=A0RVZ0_CENSY|nr:hypothetical protein CENSYa_0874 [Cenarchaeum symbiosum A]
MPLDSGFREQTVIMIEKAIEVYGAARVSPGMSKIWGSKNEADFLCGFFVGQMTGSALAAFQGVHGREPSAEDHLEIVKMIEEHAGQIRGIFDRFR